MDNVYYRTEAPKKLAEIRSGTSRALNKIVVRKEPEPEVYENPTDPQVEPLPHTGTLYIITIHHYLSSTIKIGSI